MRRHFFTLIIAIVAASTLASAQRTIGDIPAPEGFARTSESGFGAYLRALPLKHAGTPVRLYDGTEKYWQDGAFAVIDMEIGRTDLQQCADAVMRLRAEYLWRARQYSAIHFNFTSGFRADYSRWAEGERIRVRGNACSWYKAGEADYGYRSFRRYLDMVFSYAGTASLAKELTSVSLKGVKVGDVFILGGHPGHAMIIVDMAADSMGRKAIMVAQSYMPAQDIHVVTNLRDRENSPWYIFYDNTETFSFPEWNFDATQLKRF